MITGNEGARILEESYKEELRKLKRRRNKPKKAKAKK